MSTTATRRADAASGLTWQVWGTYAFLAVEEVDRLTEARALTEQMLAEIGLACSRFRDDSELCEVNRRPGQWVRASRVLVAAVRAALASAEETEGLVDPCLGRTLISLGYDRGLALLASPTSAESVRNRTQPLPDAWRDVECTDDAVRIPQGVSLDLGASAKAWAADVIAGNVAKALGTTTVVSLGGDVRVAAPDPEQPASWPVTLTEHPADLGDAALSVDVVVTHGLATSSTVVRRWAGPSGPLHHVVDPRTGLPATEVFRTVTAAGHTCLAANTATTAALILGTEAPAWLAARDVTARLVSADGVVTHVGRWPSETQTIQAEVLSR